MIDPSVASRELFQKIKDYDWRLEYILVTHAHFDHIGGVKWLKGQFDYDVKVALHPDDLKLWQEGGSAREFGFDFDAGDDPDLMIENNQVIKLDRLLLKFFTPQATLQVMSHFQLKMHLPHFAVI